MTQGAEDQGEFTVVERFLNPMDAHIVRGFLEAYGIPAMLADHHLVHMNSLLNVAVGGIGVRVPASRVAEAQEIIAAFNRGELALTDDELPDE